MRAIISVVVVLYCVSHLCVEAAKIKCTKVVDIVMVLDESGSIGVDNFQKIKQFVNDIISRFSVAPFGAHFAAVKYSDDPREVFSLNKYTNEQQLHTAVQNMNYLEGGTHTGKALDYVKNNISGNTGDRNDVPNVSVLFSDGESDDHADAVTAARAMKNKSVAILCVGLGKGNTDQKLIDQLRQLASKPKYLFQTAIDAINTIENSLVGEMCEAAGCAGVSFSKQGCYKTPHPKPLHTSKLLFNDRKNIDWGEGWDIYLENVVCRCGKKAKDEGYRFFCIEFYGECWGFKNFVNPHPASATKCWGKRPDYAKCEDKQKNPICVGTGYHGYIYEIN